MLALFDLKFVLYFLLFYLAVYISFTIPGTVLLKGLNLTPIQRFVLGTILGICFWTLQGFILGYLGLREFTYLYLLIGIILWVRFRLYKDVFHFFSSSNRYDKLTILIVLLGILLQLSSVWFSGVLFKEGLYFCCSNLQDTVLHIALTNAIVKNIPPFEPGMHTQLVQNYHYFGNLAVAELIRVYKLPLIASQYQFMTILLSLFLGLTAIVFSQLAGFGTSFKRFLLFFLYFGGDFIFALIFIVNRNINFSMSSLEDGSKFLVNPPRAFAIIIFFAALSMLFIWLKRKDLYSGTLMAIMFGLLIAFKVYVGIFALSGLFFLGVYFLYKRLYSRVLPLFIAGVTSIVVYLPVNSDAGGLYFTGLWIFENFIVQPGLGLNNLELARVIFAQHNNYLKVVLYELFYIAVFNVAIFGTKLLGFLQSKRSLSTLPKEIHIFLISGIVTSAISGFFFQQSTGGSNTFNFLVSIFIIGSIYTALACSYWIQSLKGYFKIGIIFLVILLTIPRVVFEGIINIHRLLNGGVFIIDSNELAGYEYLNTKTSPDSIILVDHSRFDFDAVSPYISFLADRPMYLSGLPNELYALGIDYQYNKLVRDTIFKSTDTASISGLLLDNKINYIVMGSNDILRATESSYFLKTEYLNNKVKILSVSFKLIDRYLEEERLRKL